MLSHLGNVPRVEVVLDLEPPFVLETLAARFRGRMDSPLLRGESSLTNSSSARSLTTLSHMSLVAIGHYGALFLLTLMVALTTGCSNI